MAENLFHRLRDCVNPALCIERKLGRVVALDVSLEDSFLNEPPPEVRIGGVRYLPAQSEEPAGVAV